MATLLKFFDGPYVALNLKDKGKNPSKSCKLEIAFDASTGTYPLKSARKGCLDY